MRIEHQILRRRTSDLLRAGGSDGQPPVANPGACDASSCGTLLIGMTDADGDFLSYSVDVVALTLRKADGTVVQALPVRQRVDFAEIVDLTELVTAATVPNGSYVGAAITLDYATAEVSVEVNGSAVPATVVDGNGQPLGVKTLDIELDNRNHVVIAPGRPALLQLDFDLAASHEVDISVNPAIAVAEPFVVATVMPVEDKELRVRGPLVSVDTNASSYVIDLRPFNHPSARLGRFTVQTNSSTAFEIDGVEYEGAAGLATLAGKPAGTRTAAFGVLDVSDRSFTASDVLAGDSVPGPRFDVVRGKAANEALVALKFMTNAAAKDVAKGSTGLPDGRGVNDGKRLFEVIHHEPVEQGLVPVLETDQVDVLLERVRLAVEIPDDALFLLLEGRDPGGQQASQAEPVPLRIGEGCPLVGARIEQQGDVNISRGHQSSSVSSRPAPIGDARRAATGCNAREARSITPEAPGLLRRQSPCPASCSGS